jgi:hypothetical protein
MKVFVTERHLTVEYGPIKGQMVKHQSFYIFASALTKTSNIRITFDIICNGFQPISNSKDSKLFNVEEVELSREQCQKNVQYLWGNNANSFYLELTTSLMNNNENNSDVKLKATEVLVKEFKVKNGQNENAKFELVETLKLANPSELELRASPVNVDPQSHAFHPTLHLNFTLNPFHPALKNQSINEPENQSGKELFVVYLPPALFFDRFQLQKSFEWFHVPKDSWSLTGLDELEAPESSPRSRSMILHLSHVGLFFDVSIHLRYQDAQIVKCDDDVSRRDVEVAYVVTGPRLFLQNQNMEHNQLSMNDFKEHFNRGAGMSRMQAVSFGVPVAKVTVGEYWMVVGGTILITLLSSLFLILTILKLRTPPSSVGVSSQKRRTSLRNLKK